MWWLVILILFAIIYIAYGVITKSKEKGEQNKNDETIAIANNILSCDDDKYISNIKPCVEVILNLVDIDSQKAVKILNKMAQKYNDDEFTELILTLQESSESYAYIMYYEISLDFSKKFLERLKKLNLESRVGCCARYFEYEKYFKSNKLEYFSSTAYRQSVYINYSAKEIVNINNNFGNLSDLDNIEGDVVSTIKFEDIISCDRQLCYKNRTTSTTTTNGGIGRAIAGGVIAGGAGAIVGATTASKSTNSINYTEIETIEIKIITKSGIINLKYKTDFDSASQLYARINDIVDENKNNKSPKSKSENKTIVEKSAKDKLKELKELFEENVITQEDYKFKKDEILKKCKQKIRVNNNPDFCS